MSDDPRTAAGFLSERADFLYVYQAGDGWDVVVRVDGTYPTEEDAIEAAEGIRHWLDMLEDVSMEGRIWWDGPPEWPN